MGFHPSLGRVRAKYAKYMYTCLCNKKTAFQEALSGKILKLRGSLVNWCRPSELLTWGAVKELRIHWGNHTNHYIYTLY